LDQLINSLAITLSPIPYGVVVAATLVAAATDVCLFKVFNWLTIPLLVGGLAYHSLAPTAEGFQFASIGAACGLLILMPAYLVGGIGAGDVKLLSGIGAWVGLHDFLAIFIVTALVSGLYSVVLMLVTGSFEKRMCSLLPRGQRTTGQRERIEDIADQSVRENRSRLVPFASMTALALLVLLGCQIAGSMAGVKPSQRIDEHSREQTEFPNLISGLQDGMGDAKC
jgi:prepilin peptidase CpaA